MAFHAAVFAHQEETRIAAALSGLLEEMDADARLTVLVNGSTDRTGAIVAELAADDRRIVPHTLPLADKAAAWNAYVFELCDGAAEAHLFLDGDVSVRPGSLAAIRATLAAHPRALAVSTLPYGGRTAEAWRASVLAEHGLPGNFYALPAATLTRIRREGFAMPVGLLGDDTFLLWLLRRGLDPAAAPDRARIVPAREAGFLYTSIPRHTLKGLAALFARHQRYGLRDLQVRLLTLALAQGTPMPRTIEEVYGAARPLTPLLSPYGRLLPFRKQKLLFLKTFLTASSAAPRPSTRASREGSGERPLPATPQP